MKEFIAILKRFIPPYRWYLVRNIIFNLLHGVFGSFSLMMMIPVLKILFGQQEDVLNCLPFAWDIDVISHNFNYYLTYVKMEYGASSSLLYVGLFVAAATFLKVTFSFWATYEMINIRNGVVRDIRNMIYAKIIYLPLAFFMGEKKGDIVARMSTDVNEVEVSIMRSLDIFFKDPILILVYLVTMFIMSWELSLFVIIMLPIVGYFIGRVGKSLKKPSREGQNMLGHLMSFIDETLGGLRVIKAFNAEEKMKAGFEADNNSYIRIANKLLRRYSLAHPMSEFLGTLVIVFVLWFGGYLILNDSRSLSVEEFFPFLGAFYSIINPAKAFSSGFYSIQKGLASMDRIDAILHAESTIIEKQDAVKLPTFEHEVCYKGVGFSYVSGFPVLKDINLTIPKGHTVALVGQSGSGKTTMVDLLPRFFDVEKGSITVDGHDVRDLELFSLRELIGNVNQEPILFNDTIFKNIAFGVKGATMEEVIEAAKVANAHSFILEKEEGYDTNIGERGGKLSGGQRQRLSIARAILKNPPILILDEATAALDTESEKLVQEALENLMKNRTTIVIAHRLTTIRKADMIVVFRDGNIVEQGTHEQLLEKGGEYTKLHNLQS